MNRRLIWGAGVVIALLTGVTFFALWSASGQLLFPVSRGVKKDLAFCPPEAEHHWGKHCGNLRQTGIWKFHEVSFENAAALKLSGWLIRGADNGRTAARGAVLLAHGGGSDRREMTRLISMYLKHGLDVLTFDYSCHGESPCAVPGLTYGERESHDILAAYNFLRGRYIKIYAFGSSVGATAVLTALPHLEGIAGVIAENAPYSFARLLRETPAAPQEIPGWFTALLVDVTQSRGKFTGSPNAPDALAATRSAPIMFIHSRNDEVVPVSHTVDLAAAYSGKKTLWLPDYGKHGAIYDANPVAYEKRVAAFLSE